MGGYESMVMEREKVVEDLVMKWGAVMYFGGKGRK